MIEGRKIIIPFNRQEIASLKEAGEIAGRCAETMRMWAEDGIGRKIGGKWAISRPALLMRLEGNTAALKAYWKGDRSSPEISRYFEMAGVPLGSSQAKDR
ncbi:hypothetical protein ACD578_15855 [Microvirga sp. RSM25]|uniref:hypothetical protein n=1 Tax=Microvirga sp. RSM25 TaxID=3273802 RepID=UPI00384BB1A1